MKNIHASDTKNNFTTLVKTDAKEHRVSVTLWPGGLVPGITSLTTPADNFDHQPPYTDLVDHHAPPITTWPSRNKIYPHLSGMRRGTNLFRGKGTDKFKINISGGASDDVVGIKFVNIFSGFLFQISNTQGQTVSVQIFDDGVSIDNYVTAKNVLVEANRSNEPSVLCQSTFN